MAADETTEEYATAMEEAINRIKRKYEPDESEVRLDKIIKMSDDHAVQFMRVQIFTEEYMLSLIHI